MNRKAIELSINFLVIVIISLVILSSGILLVRKYFSTAQEIQLQLDDQTEANIEELLDEGERVALPLKRKTIPAGEADIFGLGVLNINPGATTAFSVNIEFNELVKKNKDVLEPGQLGYDPQGWLLFEQDGFTLDFKDSKKIPIRVAVPGGVLSGTYIYNVVVLVGPQKYGLTKMYVIVP